MSQKEITAAIRELKRLEAKIDAAEREAEELKAAIKSHMGEDEELLAGGYRVTWKRITSRRVDTSALKAALPDVAAAFTKESTTRRFIVA